MSKRGVLGFELATFNYSSFALPLGHLLATGPQKNLSLGSPPPTRPWTKRDRSHSPRASHHSLTPPRTRAERSGHQRPLSSHQVLSPLLDSGPSLSLLTRSSMFRGANLLSSRLILSPSQRTLG